MRDPDCDAPCFDQLKRTHHRASPKHQTLLDVLIPLLQLIKKHGRSQSVLVRDIVNLCGISIKRLQRHLEPGFS